MPQKIQLFAWSSSRKPLIFAETVARCTFDNHADSGKQPKHKIKTCKSKPEYQIYVQRALAALQDPMLFFQFQKKRCIAQYPPVSPLRPERQPLKVLNSMIYQRIQLPMLLPKTYAETMTVNIWSSNLPQWRLHKTVVKIGRAHV